MKRFCGIRLNYSNPALNPNAKPDKKKDDDLADDDDKDTNNGKIKDGKKNPTRKKRTIGTCYSTRTLHI